MCGDITSFDGDVIVNAANPVMLGGGGVDGAIHRAAGPDLRLYCEQVPVTQGVAVRCLAGEVKPTPAGNLSAKWVFHTVAPIWDLQRAGDLRPGESVGQLSESDLCRKMGACFRKSLLMAKVMDLSSIAFPALGCGIYGWTHEQVANIAMEAFRRSPNLNIAVAVYLYPADGLPAWRAASVAHGVELQLDG